jgi:hypothetical protein
MTTPSLRASRHCPRLTRVVCFVATAVLILGCSGSNKGTPFSPPPPAPPPPPGSVDATISVDTTVRFQTMTGWEATSQLGQDDASYAIWQQQVLDLAANDLGLNRVRLEIKSSTEAVNDNNDPDVINPAGFDFSALDQSIAVVVAPMRQRLTANGQHLYVNLAFVSFRNSGAFLGAPAEYAEFMLATFQHMQSSFGFVPDAIETIVEPDNGTIWTGSMIGQAMVAAGARLAANGFHPDFIAPSTTSMANTVPYLTAILAVPGVSAYLKEVSYHRYGGVTDANLTAIHSLAAQHNLRTAMLEHIGSTVEDLYKDLTIAGVSAWQQYTLAYPSPTDNGGQYYRIVNNAATVPSRTPALRQYFRYVRAGAFRVGASSDNATLVRPVAFTNVGGAPVLVLHAAQAGTFAVRGLRPGPYSVTSSAASAPVLADVTTGIDGTLTLSAPVGAVITLFPKP